MKITPLEIRQKTFEKGFRGYEKEEVAAYLQSLSQEWERLMDEKKELALKLEQSQKEVDKLREVENSLFKTLKTAEDTGATIKDQATKMAEIHLKEAEMNAESILNDAKNKARDTVEESEVTAKQIMEEMEAQLKSMLQSYKTLENYRDDLLSDIKALSTDALERVDRIKSQIKRLDIEEQYIAAKRESKKVIQDRLDVNSSVKRENKIAIPPKIDTLVPDSEDVHTKKGQVNSSLDEDNIENIANQNEEHTEEATEIERRESNKKDTGLSFFDEID